jgi:hypothetical protein
VVRTLEELLEVNCDPDFIETYLKLLPGFESRWQLGRQIAKQTRKLGWRVQETLEDMAAREGSAAIDQRAISVAIARAAETLVDEEQPTLPLGSETLPDNVSEESSKIG